MSKVMQEKGFVLHQVRKAILRLARAQAFKSRWLVCRCKLSFSYPSRLITFFVKFCCVQAISRTLPLAS